MSAEILNHPRFKGRIPAGEGQGGQPRQPAINPRQANRASDYLKIEEELQRRGHDKLSVDDRLIIARNLGRILAHFKDERGLISDWLVEAGVSPKKGGSTKHLSRVAVYDPERKSGKGLMPKLTPYRRMAELAARKSQPRGSEDDIKIILVDLVEGSSLDPDKKNQLATLSPHERDIAESFSDLLRMLTAVANRVIVQCDVEKYFREIARWNLSSSDGAGTFSTLAHPVSSFSYDADWWHERMSLTPMVGLFDLADERDTPFLEVEWKGQDDDVPKRLELSHLLTVVFGIAPIGRNGQVVPCIGQMHLCQGVDNKESVSNKESVGNKEPIDFFAEDWCHFWSCQVSNMPPDETRFHGMKLGHNSGLQGCYGLARPAKTEGRCSEKWPEYSSRLEELTPLSIYKYLYDVPSKADMDLIREQLGINFMGPALSVEGTTAAYIERSLKNYPLQMYEVLLASAEYLSGSLQQCVNEIRAELKSSTDAFIKHQSNSSTKEN